MEQGQRREGTHMVGETRLRDGVRVSGAAWAVVIAATVLAACGGGVDELVERAAAEAATTTSSEQGSSPAASSGIEDQTFTVGEHFWHSGFRVDIVDGEITSEENQLTGDVTRFLFLNATLENNGDDVGYFGPEIAIATSNNSYPSRFGSDLPDVPGGLTSQATFDFLIDEDFDLASAELIIGHGGESRASIPLSGSGDPVRLEPSDLAISGALSMELIDMTFTSASLRYDLPGRHRQVEDGKQALTLNMDVTSRNSGNWQIFATDLALIGPDGNAVVADDVGIGSLPGTDEGVTTPDLWMRFLVDELPPGDFIVKLTPGSWFIGEDGVTEATFDFTIGQ